MREEDPRLREDDEKRREDDEKRRGDDERNREDDERNRGDDNQQDTRTRRLQAGGYLPHRQINQLFLLGFIFTILYPRGLNFISFRVWNFEFCGIFWRRRGWGMSRARRIIFA